MSHLAFLSVILFIFLSGSQVESRRFDKLKVLTFNAALEDSPLTDGSSITNNRVERRDALIRYLDQKSGPDFVCLQEVVFGQDIEAIVKGLGKQYPHSFSLIHRPDGTLPPQSSVAWSPSCNPDDFNALFRCAIDNGCASGTETKRIGLAIFQCGMKKCAKQLNVLVESSKEKCLACILATSIKNLTARCASPGPAKSLWNINKMGLLLMSKKALTDTSAVEFYPNYINCYSTGYIKAKVAGSDLTIACIDTVQYLPYTLELPPMSELYPTYILQNAYEMKELVRTFQKIKPLIICGDFNVGSSGKCRPLGEYNYNVMNSAFSTKSALYCTVCPQNVYTTGDRINNITMDHIFVNGKIKILSTKITLTTDEVSVGQQNLPLSNHYGVECAVKIKRSKKKQRKQH